MKKEQDGVNEIVSSAANIKLFVSDLKGKHLKCVIDTTKIAFLQQKVYILKKETIFLNEIEAKSKAHIWHSVILKHF